MHFLIKMTNSDYALGLWLRMYAGWKQQKGY